MLHRRIPATTRQPSALEASPSSPRALVGSEAAAMEEEGEKAPSSPCVPRAASHGCDEPWQIHLLFHPSAVAFPPPTLIPRSSHLLSRQRYQEVGKRRRRRRRRIIVLGPWRGACLSKLMPDRLSLIYPGLPLLPSQLPAASNNVLEEGKAGN